MGMSTLRWEDVKEAAKNIFNIWVDQRELIWAEKAWNMLIKQGMAEYEYEIERIKVCIRLIVLGVMYQDFCKISWQEE